MILPWVASLGLGNTARAGILVEDVGKQRHPNRTTAGDTFSMPSCVASLGLGNIARACILEGNVWEAAKIESGQGQ